MKLKPQKIVFKYQTSAHFTKTYDSVSTLLGALTTPWKEPV